MSCACHAHKHAHLRHHRDPLGPDDAEGFLARWSAPAATAAGLLLYVRVLREGLRADRATRRWVTAEAAGILAMALAAVLLDLVWLRYQLFLTLAAHSVSSFFTVWTVHRGCTPESGGPVARTERRAWMAWISLNLFYHLEHHLFPKVPVSRLPELAARLDAQAPAATRLRVLPELRCPLRACSRGAGRLPLPRA